MSAPRELGDAASSPLRCGLWSADYSRTTGQAIVTARAARVLRSAALREFVYAGSGLAMLASWLRAAGAVWRDAIAGRIDVLYIVCSRSTGGFLRDVPAYLARSAGVRIVVHTHGSDIVDLLQRPRVGWLARVLLRRCEIILPSRHLERPLRDLAMPTLHVCENFVEERSGDADAAPAVDARPPSGGATQVFWNSNIMASKGFFVLADAVAALREQGHAVVLSAIGSPLADEQMPLAECRARLEALAAQPWFAYHGPVDRDGSTRLLARGDIVGLPSTYSSECQPLALLEAMCAARAIVIADTPALRATVGAYPCEVAATVDSAAVAEAILRAAPQPPSSRADAAASARQRFSAQRFDQQFAGIVGIPHGARQPGGAGTPELS